MFFGLRQVDLLRAAAAGDLLAVLNGIGWGAFASTLLLISVSVTLGRSFLLLANGVNPTRFVLSLLVSAVTFLFTYFVWVGVIYLVVDRLYGESITLLYTAKLVTLALSPLSLALLGVLPYFGRAIVRFLYVVGAVDLYVLLGALGLARQQIITTLALAIAIFALAQFTVLRPLTWMQNRAAGRQLRRQYRVLALAGREEVR